MRTKSHDPSTIKSTVIRLRVTPAEAELFKAKAKEAGCKSIVTANQTSGMTVTAWCKEKGLSQHTYYSRLNVVRKELLKRAGLPLQQIVPLSVFSLTCSQAARFCSAAGAEIV